MQLDFMFLCCGACYEYNQEVWLGKSFVVVEFLCKMYTQKNIVLLNSTEMPFFMCLSMMRGSRSTAQWDKRERGFTK